ncbi:FUSC family protein [Acuticoccus yangtzensis]|uniref:FUSC family protein n=1 Tax=Acuticoccus yangtzensis TaxID=1443441 RepID=UPI0013008A8C|nr:FUSC family protein [Acuticoccus yangtzensis]
MAHATDLADTGCSPLGRRIARGFGRPEAQRQAMPPAHPRWVYPLKVALAAVMSLYFAFLINLEHTFWALLTVPFIVRPDAGSMVWRSAARIAGTVMGALCGFVMAVCFGQSEVTFIVSLALVLFAVGYMTRVEKGNDAYAYGVAGFTALVIAIDTGPHLETAFTLAITRATETLIPILCAFVVMLVVFPRSASEEARAKLKAARTLAAKLVADGIDDKAEIDPAEETAFLNLIALVHNDLRSLLFERNRRRWLRPRLTRVAMGLQGIVVLAESARLSLGRLPAGVDAPALSAPRRALVEALRNIYTMPPDAAAFLAAADEVDAIAARMRPAWRADGAPGEPDAPHAGTKADVGNAVFRLHRVAVALAALLRDEAALADPSLPAAPVDPLGGRYHDHIAALQYGLRPAAVFVVLSVVWLATAWPLGSIVTMVAAALTLLIPVLAPRPARMAGGVQQLYGLVAGTVGALLLIVTLPMVEGFTAFALLVGGVVFAVFYVAQEITLLPVAIGAMLPIVIGVAPANTQTYDAAALINAVIAIAIVPVAFMAGLAIIFPEDAGWLRRHLRRAVGDILQRAMRRDPVQRDRFVSDIVDVLGDYGGSIAADDPVGRHLRGRARATLIAGLDGYEMRTLEACGDLPDRLAALGPQVRDAVMAAARLPAAPCPTTASGAAVLAPFDTAGGMVADLLAGEMDGPARIATLRWGALVSLTRHIIVRGELAVEPASSAVPPGPSPASSAVPSASGETHRAS